MVIDPEIKKELDKQLVTGNITKEEVLKIIQESKEVGAAIKDLPKK